MVQRNQIYNLILKLILDLVARLFRGIRFTRRRTAGNHSTDEEATSKTSVTISGEYRKEENQRNGNSGRT